CLPVLSVTTPSHLSTLSLHDALPISFLSHQVSFGNLIHPEDRDRLWEDTQAALTDGRPFQQVYRINTASGEEKWVWEQGCGVPRSEEHTSELQSPCNLVCRLLLEKKK